MGFFYARNRMAIYRLVFASRRERVTMNLGTGAFTRPARQCTLLIAVLNQILLGGGPTKQVVAIFGRALGILIGQVVALIGVR